MDTELDHSTGLCSWGPIGNLNKAGSMLECRHIRSSLHVRGLACTRRNWSAVVSVVHLVLPTQTAQTCLSWPTNADLD